MVPNARHAQSSGRWDGVMKRREHARPRFTSLRVRSRSDLNATPNTGRNQGIPHRLEGSRSGIEPHLGEVCSSEGWTASPTAGGHSPTAHAAAPPQRGRRLIAPQAGEAKRWRGGGGAHVRRAGGRIDRTPIAGTWLRSRGLGHRAAERPFGIPTQRQGHRYGGGPQ